MQEAEFAILDIIVGDIINKTAVVKGRSDTTGKAYFTFLVARWILPTKITEITVHSLKLNDTSAI